MTGDDWVVNKRDKERWITQLREMERRGEREWKRREREREKTGR